MARQPTRKPRTATKPRDSADQDERKSTRDIWKGAITFGLVEIPVALVSAEKPGGLSLSYLDRRDFAPVGYRRYNKVNDKEVAWGDIVHGFEYEKGEYVVLGKTDLARANPGLTQTIHIEEFVDASEIEPIYFEKPYYLEPLRPGSKSYALLRETLRRTKKIGVARVVVRTREHIAVVGVRDRALVLYLLRFAEELRPTSSLHNIDAKGRAAEVSAKEVALAERLVADMTSSWNPDAYKDEYVKDVMKVVQAKIASGETHALEEKTEARPSRSRGEIIDLMPLLRRSVEAARTGSKRPRMTSAQATSARATSARAANGSSHGAAPRNAHRPTSRRRSA